MSKVGLTSPLFKDTILQNVVLWVIEDHPRITTIGVRFSSGDQCTVKIFRDDRLHSVVSGNKWRKILPIFSKIKSLDTPTIISMGGAHSNHIDALSWSAQTHSVQCYCFVRGQEHLNTPTLESARARGTQILPLSRTQYDRLRTAPLLSISQLLQQYRTSCKQHTHILSKLNDRSLFIPEGGRCEWGMDGGKALISDLEQYTSILDHSTPSTLACSIGSGLTAFSISYALMPQLLLRIYSPFKGIHAAQSAYTHTMNALKQKEQWLKFKPFIEFIEGGALGRYGTPNAKLIEWINFVWQSTRVPLDPLYNSRALYLLLQDLALRKIRQNQEIILLHTGGLQGIKGMNERISLGQPTIEVVLD